MRLRDIQKVQNRFFIGLVVVTSLAFLWLIQDLLQPVFWAAVLTILFRPIYRRINVALHGRERLASALTLVVILLAVILPLFFIGMAVVQEAANLVDRVASGEVSVQESVEQAEEALPAVIEYLDRFGIDVDRARQGLSGAAVAGSQYLASQALTIGQNALQFGVLFFVMLYLLFFLLKDGDTIFAAIIKALPLGDRRERLLFSKFAQVSRATIKGTLVVGAVQGLLGGLTFWVLGINAAVFWGIVMTVLSLLPAIGAALIWIPAAVILLATGSYVKGVILVLLGTFVISLVDNFLRPILVSRDTEMPDYLVLIATLGGLTAFGISGFVIGPIIAALFLTVWSMFEDEHGSADNAEVERVKEAAQRSDVDPPPLRPGEEDTVTLPSDPDSLDGDSLDGRSAADGTRPEPDVRPVAEGANGASDEAAPEPRASS